MSHPHLGWRVCSTNMKKKTNTASQRILVLHEPSAHSHQEASRIPEIRTSLRQQIKLLRSVGTIITILAIVSVIIFWNAMIDSCTSVYGFYAYIILGGLSVMVIASAFLVSLVIRISAGEIEEQTKKLNKEV